MYEALSDCIMCMNIKLSNRLSKELGRALERAGSTSSAPSGGKHSYFARLFSSQ